MAYEYYNPNPCGKSVDDCVVRAITKVFGLDWDTAYWDLAIKGFMLCEMPPFNTVWESYLYDHGYRKHLIEFRYPEAYTVRDFCEDHPKGTYILATGTHVIAVDDSTWYDAADSGNEVISSYWKREDI